MWWEIVLAIGAAVLIFVLIVVLVLWAVIEERNRRW